MTNAIPPPNAANSAGCGQVEEAKAIQKWEYLVVGVGDDATDNANTMSQFGEKGWEFVAVYQNRSGYPLAYFKRQK